MYACSSCSDYRGKRAWLTIVLSPEEWHLHEQDGQLPQYVLKREVAEGAIYMTMLQFPYEALLTAQDRPDALYW